MDKKKKIIIACIALVVIIAGVLAFVFKDKLFAGKGTATDSDSATEAATEVATEIANGISETVPEGAPVASGQPQKLDENGQALPQATEEPKVDPTFVYFVDNQQEAETADLIKELKEEFPNVVFDIRNTDKDADTLKNFPMVDGNTPALIMLDTSNNICSIEMKCTDKSTLENRIKAALGN